MQATMKRETSNVIRRSTALVHIMKASTLEIKNIYIFIVFHGRIVRDTGFGQHKG